MAQPSAQSLTPEAAWKLMKQDYLLRLSLQTRKFDKDYQLGLNALQTKVREKQNSGYFLQAFVEYSVKEASERADWALNTCREIWKIQGRSQSHALYRAIFNGALVPLFGGRASVAEGHLQLKAMRDRTFRIDGTGLGHLKREFSRLASEWNTRLEIESRNAQNQMRGDPQLAALRASVDPCGDNPFPPSDVRHPAWAEATAKAEQKLHLFKAAGVAALEEVKNQIDLTNGAVLQRYELARVAHLVEGTFDIWAGRAVNVVWDQAALRDFDNWLVGYGEQWLESVKGLDGGRGEQMIPEIRLKLMGRIEFWQSEARRFLIEQGEHHKTNAALVRVTDTASVNGETRPLEQGTKAQSVRPEITLQMKLADPKKYPLLTIAEAAAAIEKSKQTVYRWLSEGKLRRPKMSGRVFTEEVGRLRRDEKDDKN